MLGNRMGLPFGGSPMSLVAQLKRSGAVMALFSDSITGIKYQILSPRTLPNGIKNSDTIQRVSGDVVLTAADITSLGGSQDLNGFSWFSITKKTDNVVYGNSATNLTNAKTLYVGEWTPIDSRLVVTDAYQYVNYSATGYAVALPLGTTFAQAQALLTGTVIRYQLATPIDTLNTPPPTPWIDLTGNTNNATMQGFANTSDSGMAYVPLVCETGTPVEYSNLVVNGDFANGTTGWNSVNATIANESGRLAITASAQHGRSDQTINGLVIGNKYSVTITVEGTTNNYAFVIGIGSTTTNLTINGVQRISFIFTATATTHTIGIGDIRTTGFTKFWADNAMVVNLGTPQITALESQLPNPLTAIECDRIFPFVPTTGVSKIAVRPLMVFDGINDYGELANNPSVDIVGTGDFAIAVGFLTPSIVGNTTLYFDGNNGVNVSERKIQFYIISDGTLAVILEGNAIALSTPNTIIGNAYYDCRLERKSGRLTCELNGGVTYNQPNTLNLISKSFKRVGARTNDAAGSTHSAYFKGGIGWLVGAKGAEVANLDKALDRKARDYRMMG